MAARGKADAEPQAATDVLVLGGGPAGAWAAISAARAGARVVLADKGYCGTSGAAAAGGNNLWYVPPDAKLRQDSIEQREREGGFITDREWMARTLSQTWDAVGQLASWGYPFPLDDDGQQRRSSLQGPEYMRLMRRQLLRAGVRILDHHPGLELLIDPDGVVSGASGVARQEAERPWSIVAGSVILATGGCAFLSNALGLNPDTGDGHLMAAELGAELSGMEFSGAYGMAPGFGSQTKGRMYQFASYYHADGTPMDLPPGFTGRDKVSRAMLTETVHARLDQVPEVLHDTLRWAQPNFFLPFDKAGIDPFRQVFPVRLVLEGTVRGTGGLRLVSDGCATTVPGLFAAGDVATRELITGGRSGGGSHNGAWAMSSGTWAGRAAAAHAQSRRQPSLAGLTHAGRFGLRPTSHHAVAARDVVDTVQQQVFPLERNLFRRDETLRESLDTLDDLWAHAVPSLVGGGATSVQRSREAAAMVAHARWMYRSALERTESRAMHQRDDYPQADASLAYRLLCGGLDTVWVAPEPGIGRVLLTAVRALDGIAS